MSSKAIEGIEPKVLWERFYEISQVPRPSKKEEKILAHLKSFLKEHNIDFNEDKTGNIVAYVPATKGYENAPTVVLQGHVDMVCEKNKGTKHDFENDPIKLLREDGWITADGTTLGSDNGIGVAAALATITDDSIVHGPLELLMTVDEETGLTGANNLEPGFIKGKILLNMDSEEDGAFYVGCSGGVDTIGNFNIETSSTPDGFAQYEILVTGLKGGHSGLDIHQGRGNAIKILARSLDQIKDVDFRIVKIDGGSLRNAIPREAEATIAVKKDDATKIEEKLNKFSEKVSNEYKRTEPDLKIEFSEGSENSGNVFSQNFSSRIIKAMLALPHGIIAMSQDIEGLVETSTNLATVKMNEGSLKIGTSQRSSIESAKEYVATSVASIFDLAAGEVILGDGYPGWKPDLDSKILNISKNVFKDLFNKEPEIKAIHAGLECGILESKNPGLDMVSFGPTIEGAHSPDEKINIETVERFYKLMKGILKRVAETGK